MARPIRLISGFLTVGVWTMASRVLGFVRDILIAAWLGSGPVAQAFFVAFALPNMFRRFFAEGAFNMAFVPMFSKKLESGDAPEAFARDAFAGLASLLILITLIATIFMPWLVLAMASGFLGDARFDIAVTFGRIAFGYIFFISLAALLSGVLNAAGRFAVAAAAPVLLNIILISALFLAESGAVSTVTVSAALGETGAHHGTLITYGVLLAGLAQFVMLWIAAKRAGFDLRPKRPVWTPDLKRLLIIAAPAALAGGVVQINLLVGRQVASFFDGAIAWLNWADRLYQLPLGVVGIAIGVVLLPELSRRLSAEDTAGGRDAFNRAAEFSLALCVPAAVALVVVPLPIVSVLYERGAFTADDAAATALATAIYALGLPAFVLQKVFQPLFFAREDTKRPFYYALVAMVVNAAIAIGLAPGIGFVAAAIGTTVAGWAMLACLWIGARDMGDAAAFDDRFRRRIWRLVLAAFIMGLALWVLQFVLSPLLETAGWRYLGLLLLVALGMATYALAGLRLGAFSVAELKGAVRRG